MVMIRIFRANFPCLAGNKLDTDAIRQPAPNDFISPAHAGRQSFAGSKSRLEIVFEGRRRLGTLNHMPKVFGRGVTDCFSGFDANAAKA
jgi:hypothetical protein